jgi:hypothetical protein
MRDDFKEHLMGYRSDLGVYFDAELNMKAHIRRVAGASYYHLRRLWALRGLLGQEVTARLVSAFILSQLDYCNAVLIRLPVSTLAPLQRVMHAAVRLVCDLKPHDHVNPCPSSASNKAEDWLQSVSPRASNHQWKSSILPTGSHRAACFSYSTHNTSFCQSS